MSIGSRIKNAWNAFRNNTSNISYDYSGSYYRPDRLRLSRGNERTIVTSVFNRIAVDVSSINIYHCQLDDNGRLASYMNSNLNKCLTIEANIDQTARAFMLDVVMSMLDEGCVAIVPTDTTDNPNLTDSYDILSMRTGKIVQWYPTEVTVELYNERKGQKEQITLKKDTVAIVENPFFSIMNEPNSTLQRLMRKLVLLDAVDEETSSGKLDLIIQLPYTIRSDLRKQQAEERRKSIEEQLAGSKYGIAYADSTEKITQLNRPLENNLMKQIEYLTSMLYSQLGITEDILNGQANEQTMLNYYSRTIEPIITAITNEMTRKFLSKTAITQHKTIAFFRDPFKLVPLNNIADIADKFTRNEILSSNELRQIIGIKPSDDPRANMLNNSNIKQDYGAEEYLDEYGNPITDDQNYEEEYDNEQNY